MPYIKQETRIETSKNNIRKLENIEEFEALIKVFHVPRSKDYCYLLFTFKDSRIINRIKTILNDFGYNIDYPNCVKKKALYSVDNINTFNFLNQYDIDHLTANLDDLGDESLYVIDGNKFVAFMNKKIKREVKIRCLTLNKN